jgi:hypothetical protein
LGLFFLGRLGSTLKEKKIVMASAVKQVFLGIKTIAVANARAGAKLLLCLEG